MEFRCYHNLYNNSVSCSSSNTSSWNKVQLKRNKPSCLPCPLAGVFEVFVVRHRSVFSLSCSSLANNSPGTGAQNIMLPAAQRSAHWPVGTSILLCLCSACLYTRAHAHFFFSDKSAHIRGRTPLPISNWWSIQIKMNLHHTNRGSGEQSAGSLQSAGIAGGLSPLSSGLLSLNPVAFLPTLCKLTGHTELTAAPVWIRRPGEAQLAEAGVLHTDDWFDFDDCF